MEGKRLAIENDSKRRNNYPKDTKMKEHLEKLNRFDTEFYSVEPLDVFDYGEYPMIGGKTSQMAGLVLRDAQKHRRSKSA